MQTTKTTACGGLVLYVPKYDERDGVDRPTSVDYYARGVGWTSYDAAKSSWTAAEQTLVSRWRREQQIA